MMNILISQIRQFELFMKLIFLLNLTHLNLVMISISGPVFSAFANDYIF